jgi:ABC-type transport system involved in multi-copper enzyme maturation permease subunit
MSSTMLSATPAAVEQGARREARPSFVGILRGELFKVSRTRSNWVILGGITLLLFGIFFLLVNTAGPQKVLANQPLLFLYHVMGAMLAVQRAFIGIFLLIATARMVGLEHQQGTLRILLARGVGRLQLLGAKLLAMAIVALVVFACALVLSTGLVLAAIYQIQGNLDALQSLTPEFWTATGVYILTVLISMGVSILLATSVTIVSRSLSFGLAGALGWFAADNIGILVGYLVFKFTNNDFWLKVPAYFLGPELNLMPSVVVPALTFTTMTEKGPVTGPLPVDSIGFTPMVTYDGTHALLVALIYAVIFAVSAAVVIWRRDVLD